MSIQVYDQRTNLRVTMIPQSSRKIVTYGYDACHRWLVLRLAGFTVIECGSIQELRNLLLSTSDFKAAMMAEDIVNLPREAVVTARSYFAGPLVLFEGGRYLGKRRADFDLCVPVLTRPEDWLPRVTQVIENYCSSEVAHNGDTDIQIRS